MADEIMTEIRRIKEELAARCGFDLNKLYLHLKQRERVTGGDLVNLTKRPKKRRRNLVRA